MRRMHPGVYLQHCLVVHVGLLIALQGLVGHRPAQERLQGVRLQLQSSKRIRERESEQHTECPGEREGGIYRERINKLRSAYHMLCMSHLPLFTVALGGFKLLLKQDKTFMLALAFCQILNTLQFLQCIILFYVSILF